MLCESESRGMMGMSPGVWGGVQFPGFYAVQSAAGTGGGAADWSICVELRFQVTADEAPFKHSDRKWVSAAAA